MLNISIVSTVLRTQSILIQSVILTYSAAFSFIDLRASDSESKVAPHQL